MLEISKIKYRSDAPVGSGEQGDDDQPPGLFGGEPGLPSAMSAAARIDGFVSWFGDGEVWDRTPLGDEPEEPTPPLYARDLEALARSARDVPALVAEVEQLRVVADSMDHFAEVAERVERRNNVLRAEVERLRGCIDAAVSSLESSTAGPDIVLTGMLRDALATDV